MSREGVERGPHRENYSRLNRLFQNGTFPNQKTLSTTSVSPWAATAVTAVVLLDRTSNKITLQMVGSLGVTNKVGGFDPQLLLTLPEAFRPASAVALPWPISINGNVEIGLVNITVAGNVTWQRVGGADTWLNNNPAAIAASAVTYLGS